VTFQLAEITERPIQTSNRSRISELTARPSGSASQRDLQAGPQDVIPFLAAGVPTGYSPGKRPARAAEQDFFVKLDPRIYLYPRLYFVRLDPSSSSSSRRASTTAPASCALDEVPSLTGPQNPPGAQIP
jgi:hypothetical protein